MFVNQHDVTSAKTCIFSISTVNKFFENEENLKKKFGKGVNQNGMHEVISEIRKGRIRWVEHVERIPKERTVKKVFKNIPEGKRSVGKLRKMVGRC